MNPHSSAVYASLEAEIYEGVDDPVTLAELSRHPFGIVNFLGEDHSGKHMLRHPLSTSTAHDLLSRKLLFHPSDRIAFTEHDIHRIETRWALFNLFNETVNHYYKTEEERNALWQEDYAEFIYHVVKKFNICIEEGKELNNPLFKLLRPGDLRYKSMSRVQAEEYLSDKPDYTWIMRNSSLSDITDINGSPVVYFSVFSIKLPTMIGHALVTNIIGDGFYVEGTSHCLGCGDEKYRPAVCYKKHKPWGYAYFIEGLEVLLKKYRSRPLM